MFPYFAQPTLNLGPITIHAFGVMVALAVIFGEMLATRRAKLQGLDPHVTDGVVWWAIIIGFIISHVYSAVFYFPDRLLAEPLYIFKVWDGISSFGGMLGGLFAIWLYFRLKQPKLPTIERWRHLDALAFAFPFAWVFGRLGCTLAHDHPGIVTNFPLSVSLSSQSAQDYIWGVYASSDRLADLPGSAQLAQMGFFDLGLIEFLYTLLIIVPVFLLLDRKPRAPGFFLLSFLAIYTPVRFGLDFLRLVDVQYFGLTPGQWAALPLFLASVYMLLKVVPKWQPTLPQAGKPEKKSAKTA
jgi:phosphatidylglycerol---prolipoprotein diacylglyceryl transferase